MTWPKTDWAVITISSPEQSSNVDDGTNIVFSFSVDASSFTVKIINNKLTQSGVRIIYYSFIISYYFNVCRDLVIDNPTHIMLIHRH